jgi:hypothetical protein
MGKKSKKPWKEDIYYLIIENSCKIMPRSYFEIVELHVPAGFDKSKVGEAFSEGEAFLDGDPTVSKTVVSWFHETEFPAYKLKQSFYLQEL